MECLIDHVIKLFTKDPALPKNALSSLLKTFDSLNNEGKILAYPIQLLSKNKTSHSPWETFVLAFKCPKSISEEMIQIIEVSTDKAMSIGSSEFNTNVLVDESIEKSVGDDWMKKGRRRISFDLKKSQNNTTDASNKDVQPENKGDSPTQDRTRNRNEIQAQEDESNMNEELVDQTYGSMKDVKECVDDELMRVVADSKQDVSSDLKESTENLADKKKRSNTKLAEEGTFQSDEKDQKGEAFSRNIDEISNKNQDGSSNQNFSSTGAVDFPEDSRFISTNPSEENCLEAETNLNSTNTNTQAKDENLELSGAKSFGEAKDAADGRRKSLVDLYANSDHQIEENGTSTLLDENINEPLSDDDNRRKSFPDGNEKNTADRDDDLHAISDAQVNEKGIDALSGEAMLDNANGTLSNASSRRNSLSDGKMKQPNKHDKEAVDMKKSDSNGQWWMKNMKNRRASLDKSEKLSNSKESEKDGIASDEKAVTTEKVKEGNTGCIAVDLIEYSKEGVSEDSANDLLADSNVDKFENSNTQPSLDSSDNLRESEIKSSERDDNLLESADQIDGKHQSVATKERRASLRKTSRDAVCLETISELDSALAKSSFGTSAHDGLVLDERSCTENSDETNIGKANDTNSTESNISEAHSDTVILPSSTANDSSDVGNTVISYGTGINGSAGVDLAMSGSPTDASVSSGIGYPTGVDHSTSGSLLVDASVVSRIEDSTDVDHSMSGAPNNIDDSDALSKRRSSHKRDSWSHRHSDFYNFAERDVDFYQDKFGKLPPSMLHSADEYEVDARKGYEIDYNTNMDIFDIIRKMREKTSRVITKQQQIKMKMKVLNTNIEYMP